MGGSQSNYLRLHQILCHFCYWLLSAETDVSREADVAASVGPVRAGVHLQPEKKLVINSLPDINPYAERFPGCYHGGVWAPGGLNSLYPESQPNPLGIFPQPLFQHIITL